MLIYLGPVQTASEVINYTDVPADEKEKYREFVFRCGVMNDYQCSVSTNLLSFCSGSVWLSGNVLTQHARSSWMELQHSQI